MEILILFLVFIYVAYFSMIVLSLLSNKKMVIGQRMANIESMGDLTDDDDTMKRPFIERVIQPIYLKLTEVILRLTPKQLRTNYEFLIIKAGRTKKTTPTSIITLQLLVAIFLGTMLYLLTGLNGKNANFGLIFIFSAMGFMLPYSSLNTAAQKRKKDIQKSLPDFIDLLYVSVEAGLGFDSALKKTASKMKCDISDEMSKAMDDIVKGRDRQEAFRGVVNRTGVDDVNTFITAVLQSEQLGTNIVGMLRVQSTVMRQKRRQRAEEAAMKIPVKMLFPIVFLMFPSLLVIIMGPALLNIMDTLGGKF